MCLPPPAADKAALRSDQCSQLPFLYLKIIITNTSASSRLRWVFQRIPRQRAEVVSRTITDSWMFVEPVRTAVDSLAPLGCKTTIKRVLDNAALNRSPVHRLFSYFRRHCYLYLVVGIGLSHLELRSFCRSYISIQRGSFMIPS